MKNITRLICLIIAIIMAEGLHAQAPFNKGLNLTGWFQVSSPKKIQFAKYTRQDLVNIKSLGCEVIRLPISLHEMTSGSPNYTIDPLFFRFMDSVVNWAEQLNLYLILDDHSFNPSVSTTAQVEDILVKVWPQMAGHYKNRSNYILYEILNEPHGITTQVWATIQQHAIDAIRTVDTKHTIIVGGSGYNTYTELQNLPVYADTNLIYTFHFYDPFMFTHQGASWNTPSMVTLSGVPFPYDPATMPPCPPDLLGTWVESALNNYPNDGTVAHVKSLIDIAVNFRAARNVKIFCGEFGAYIPNCDTTDRVFYYQTVREYLEEKGIPWATWDYQGGFGLFKKGSNQLFKHDLNVPLLQALGFNVPPQTPFSIVPDTTGIKVYSDFIGPDINDASYGSGTLSFYSDNLPDNDDFCIEWMGFSQYNTVAFDFVPDHDFSQLVANGYALDFMVRGNESDIKFDARFLDTKTEDPNDHPWRIGVTIDGSTAPWDKRWHHVHIPLSEFTERGSWDNGSWYNSQGLFDWTAIDRFEFSTEYTGTSGNQVWFDNILITDQDTAIVRETGTLGNGELAQALPLSLKAYPNPMTSETTISYYLPANQTVHIDLYSMNGSRFCKLFSGYQSSGLHHVGWKGVSSEGYPAGKGGYICRIYTETESGSCIIIKS